MFMPEVLYGAMPLFHEIRPTMRLLYDVQPGATILGEVFQRV